VAMEREEVRVLTGGCRVQFQGIWLQWLKCNFLLKGDLIKVRWRWKQQGSPKC